MKQYLLVGIALLFVSANASLKEDFAQMDREEAKLLNEMRKAASLNDDIDDEEEETETKNEQETMPASAKEDNDDLDEPEESAAPENREETILKNATEEVEEKEKAQDAVSDKLAIIKEEMASIDAAFEKSKEARLKTEIEAKQAEIIAVRKAQEEAAKAQREAEKREVEAYEKKRAEKLAEEAAAKAVLEKKQLAQKALEEKALKEKQAAAKVTKETPAEPKDKVTSTIGDINVTRELEEKTKIANEEYEKAVKEMQEED